MEAIIAIFVLAGGALACFTLLIQSFRYQSRTQKLTEATLLAEQTLEGIRLWGQSPTNFDSDWALYAGSTLPSSSVAGMACKVSVSSLRGPGTALTPCYRVVGLEVVAGSQSLLHLEGLIGSPLRKVNSITPMKIEQASGPSALHHDQSAIYQAYLLDEAGQPIPGLRFQWDEEPYTDGSHSEPGLGAIAELPPNRVNLTHRLAPGPGYDSGWMRVKASCRYLGQVYQTAGPLLELQEP